MKPVPESVIVNTGEQHLIRPTIDNFFQDTAECIKADYRLAPGPNPFLINSGRVAYYPFPDMGKAPITDDRVTYLSFNGRVIALVMETRTEYNHVQYTFFRNTSGIEELVQIHNELCADASDLEVK